jgi:hypothetical protein
MKMELKLKNTKVEHMVEMMKHGPPYDNLVERRLVKEISETESLIYIKIKMGGFMSLRDNLVKKTVLK